MNRNVLSVLREPGGNSDLVLSRIDGEIDGEIKSGELTGAVSKKHYPIINFIPRFVSDDGYNTSFGKQWHRYSRTQIDRYNGTKLSHDRFYSSTGWKTRSLDGLKILEVGCGAGRFTEVLLEEGADVYSVDYSSAVDVCYKNHGSHPNWFIAQADIYALPFQTDYFDRIICYGVLQHTPDPKKAFLSLIPFLRPGGEVAIDLYRQSFGMNRWTSKYWYRFMTKRMPMDKLLNLVEWYVPRWLPIDTVISRIPVLRTIIPGFVPCWNYTGVLPLNKEQIVEWAKLDTFDALSPWYDKPQTISGVKEWFEKAGLRKINVRAGGNGILANGTK